MKYYFVYIYQFLLTELQYLPGCTCTLNALTNIKWRIIKCEKHKKVSAHIDMCECEPQILLQLYRESEAPKLTMKSLV